MTFDPFQELLWTGNYRVCLPSRLPAVPSYRVERERERDRFCHRRAANGPFWSCQGRVTSFYKSDLTKYTSFLCHRSKEPGSAVRQILVNDVGVLSLSKGALLYSLRRGMALWSLRLVILPG